MRVIADEGEQLGIMSPQEALREAMERGLDLVEVAPNATPPVCRILDYGKYKYQQSKRAKESKKHQHVVTLKEVKYRPKIDKHDFDYKTNHCREFLIDGSKVKVTIMFRGREVAHPEFGRDLLARVIEATKDLVDDPPDPRHLRMEGRNMVMVLTPGKGAVRLQKELLKQQAQAAQGAAEATETDAQPAQDGAEATVEMDAPPLDDDEDKAAEAPVPAEQETTEPQDATP